MENKSNKQKFWSHFILISLLTLVLLSGCDGDDSEPSGGECIDGRLYLPGALEYVICSDVPGNTPDHKCVGEKGYAECKLVDEELIDSLDEQNGEADESELQTIEYICLNTIDSSSENPDEEPDSEENQDEELGQGGGGGGLGFGGGGGLPTTDPTTTEPPGVPTPPTAPTDPTTPEEPSEVPNPVCYEGEWNNPCDLIDEDDYIGKTFTIPEENTIHPLDMNFCDEYGVFPTDFGDYSFKFEILETIKRDDNTCFAKVTTDKDIDGVRPDLYVTMYEVDTYLIDTDPIVGFGHVDPDDFEHTLEFGAKSLGYYYPDNKIDVQFVLDYVDELNKEVFIRLDETEYKTDENKIDFYEIDLDDVIIDDKNIQGYWILSNPCTEWEINRANLEKLYEKYRAETDKLRMIISFDDLTCLSELLDNKAERQCNNECSTSNFYYDGEHCFEDEICSTPCLSYDCRPQPTKVISIDNYRFDESQIEIFQGTTIAFENFDAHVHRLKHDHSAPMFEFEIAQHQADYYLFEEIGTYDVISDEFVHMRLRVKVIEGSNYEISCYDECGFDSYSDGSLCFSDIDCEVLCETPDTCYELEQIQDTRFLDTAFIQINNSLSINDAKDKIDESCIKAEEFKDVGIEVIPIIVVDDSVSVDWMDQITHYTNECKHFNGIVIAPWEDIIEKSINDFSDIYYSAFSKEFS